jgi:hypothetical protein
MFLIALAAQMLLGDHTTQGAIDNALKVLGLERVFKKKP